MESRLEENDPSLQRRRISHRTSQLPVWSRILYKIEHYTVLPAVALVVTVTVVSLVVTIAILDFPKNWVAPFELSASSATLIMVFAIQHTQGREQAATQRKLDEFIRALPEANESLMMLRKHLESSCSTLRMSKEKSDRILRTRRSVATGETNRPRP